jgi:hypothetical protein
MHLQSGLLLAVVKKIILESIHKDGLPSVLRSAGCEMLTELVNVFEHGNLYRSRYSVNGGLAGSVYKAGC